jgi:hypothetical protein
MAEDPVVASLRAAVAAAPDDVPLRPLLARKLLDASAVDKAMAEIGAAIQRDPSSTEAQQLMREALGQPAPTPAPSTVEYNWAAAEDEVREIIPPRFVENTPDEEEEPATYQVERSTVTLADVGGMAEVKERLEIAFLAPMPARSRASSARTSCRSASPKCSTCTSAGPSTTCTRSSPQRAARHRVYCSSTRSTRSARNAAS